MGSQSRNHLAMDAQTRQADAMERIANALERLANKFAPAGTVRQFDEGFFPQEEEHRNGQGT